jgi:pilus assembly protein CpaF
MKIEIFNKIEKILQRQSDQLNIDFDENTKIGSLDENFQSLIKNELAADCTEVQLRVQSELNGLGPLDQLLQDSEITEILVNRFDQIYFEKKGHLARSPDHFFSEASYLAAIDRLSQTCQTYMNREKPFVETQLGRFRITLIFSELSRGHSLLSIRLQPEKFWTLTELQKSNWCTPSQAQQVQQIFQQRKNFLVVGGTGSGKTSFLQALLGEMKPDERAVMIEDTQELHPTNGASISLLTRQDPSQNVKEVTMDDLVKRALRLRPDRLVIGEIRGAEAKSLLMALATGHDGSFGSMHARNAHEALLRLEMLIQMGAPQWNLYSIRKLIAMTIQNIFVVEKINGARLLSGIYQISSVEESGITTQQIDD